MNNISTFHYGDEFTIKIDKNFDKLTANDVTPLFNQFIADVGKDIYNKTIVLDFEDLEFMDSSGVGAIVYMFKRMVNPTKQFKIKNADPKKQPSDLMGMLRIDKIISIERD